MELFENHGMLDKVKKFSISLESIKNVNVGVLDFMDVNYLSVYQIFS